MRTTLQTDLRRLQRVAPVAPGPVGPRPPMVLQDWWKLPLMRIFVLVLFGAVFGLFAGSNFSLSALEFGGRYIPEPFFLAWMAALCFAWPEFRAGLIGIFKNKFLLIGLALVVFGAIMGLGNGKTFPAVYGDARATALLMIAFALTAFRWRNRVEWEWLLLSSFISACTLDALRPEVFDLQAETGSVKISMSFWAAIGMAVIAMRWRSIFPFILALGFSVYFAKIGFFRLYYLGPVCVVGVMFATALTTIRQGGRGLIFSLVLLVCTGSAASYGYRRFDAFVDSLSSTVSGRMHAVDRTNQFIEGLKSGDMSTESERMESFKLVAFSPWELIIPNGSGWRDSMSTISARFGRRSIISTMDSGALYIAFHYGILVFYGFLAASVLYLKTLYVNHRNLAYFLGASCILIVGAFNFFSEAGMFTIVPRAIQFGSVIALLLPPLAFVVPPPPPPPHVRAKVS